MRAKNLYIEGILVLGLFCHVFASDMNGKNYGKDNVLNYPAEIYRTDKNVSIPYANYDAITDGYLDSVLKLATSKFRDLGIDPLSLPDLTETFEKKVLFVTFYGGFSASNIRLSGLSSLHRSGTSDVTSSGTLQKARATLGVRAMNVVANARAWFGKISIPFHLSANVDNAKVTIWVEIAVNNGNVKPKATQVIVNEIGHIKLTIKNLGPLNWIVEKIGGLVVNKVKDSIKSAIAGPILNAINDALKSIPL